MNRRPSDLLEINNILDGIDRLKSIHHQITAFQFLEKYEEPDDNCEFINVNYYLYYVKIDYGPTKMIGSRKEIPPLYNNILFILKTDYSIAFILDEWDVD